MANSESAAGQIRSGPARRIQLSAGGRGVTRVELFLDLVFVYAFLNVTNLMAANLHPEGLLQGAVVVLLLWRCWVSFTWLGNVVRLDRGLLPPIVFALAVTLLLIGVAIPEAFRDRPGGWPGPLVFVAGFLLARAGALLIMTYARWDIEHAPRPVRRAWLPVCASAPLLLGAALLPAHLPWNVEDLRLALFLIAAAVDYTGLRAVGQGNWQIRSVRHWAERHSLVVLIALGETIISVGISRGLAGGPPITWSVIGGSVQGIVVVAVLWWAYFDLAQPAAEQAMERISGTGRSVLGRDAYDIRHLPMIGGLVLLALGLKHALATTEPSTAHLWDRTHVLILYGGVVLYLLGLIGLERRTIRLLGRSPILGVLLLLTLLPIALRLPVLGVLGLLAAAVASMVLADLTLFGGRHRALHRAVEPGVRAAAAVTPKELFFDLLFVYAFIQVTVLLTRRPSVVGLVQGMALLVLLWWAWCCYAWLANVVRSEAAVVRLGMLVAAALTLVAGIAIPQAFDRVPGGLPGPLIFVTCYLALRVLHLGSFWLVTRRDPALHGQLRRAVVPAGAALVLLLCASLFIPAQEPITPVGTALWVTAVVVDLGGGYLVGPRSWQVRSVEHWTDRFALIILIALGEAVISTGVALGSRPMSGSVITAVLLSSILLAALWWTYFDRDAAAGQRALQTSTELRRATFARDAYTYLHLPLVVGLMLVAFGLRTTLAHVGSSSAAGPTALGHYTLFCGVIIYLLADQLIWARTRHQLRWRQVFGTLVVAALAPLTTPLPALLRLALLTAATVGLTVMSSAHT
ncbi:Low temperature requirement protein LtrA [Micromonospora rhizosphaerae]|uniref:Low temperature requirement protein LtrA n=1 Tax=Micromonospora rhizosphaerae TaxID=568872 RepID=A0A1C6STT4_9ACTN|nr:low temperature requirement protein A [Micromonospora rhizosphaerae]SCL32941.1 Low temperature requirement protein LtrA [Micromonospora rhizosphaerae]